jgi:hypothetical protein
LTESVSRPAISIQDLRFLIRYGTPFQVPFADNGINVEVKPELTDGRPSTALFTRPAVVEVIGAGFDRLPNSRLETLRFPQITKVHHDRGFLNAIDFDSYLSYKPTNSFLKGIVSLDHGIALSVSYQVAFLALHLASLQSTLVGGCFAMHLAKELPARG